MAFLDILQQVIQLQEYCDLQGNCWSDCLDQGAICPATAFNAIGAAFATQGYWVQADLLNFLTLTGMGLWAPLLYIMAAFGGFVSLALGQPPRTYMWFFMGPAIYAWLLDSRQNATGVEWRVGGQKQDQYEVWKLAEAGLINNGLVKQFNIPIRRNAPPGSTGPGNAPTQFASVAMPFMWFDEVISDTIQQMTRWFGVFDQLENTGGGSNSNINEKPNINIPQRPEAQWYLLSNTKWEMLWNITAAKLHSAELRDAFVTFLSSECGDLLKRSIDDAALISVANAKGRNLTTNSSIFIREPGRPQYELLTQLMRSQTIPTPPGLKKLLSERTTGSLMRFTTVFGSVGPIWGADEQVTCSQYLSLLVHGFRWEAGHILNQLVTAAPAGTLPSEVVYSLLYGWDIKNASGTRLTMEQQVQFITNLIIVHLIRNELSIAPALVDQRYASSARSLEYTKTYQKAVGSMAKYAEVYTWAKMIPYLQGVLLYLLAMAYPFACIVIVIPGMHKSLFTWMSFWAWVKLWDLGFAIVVVLERSVWAMLGNNSNASLTNDLVVQMANWGAVLVRCPGGNEIPSGNDAAIGCPVPEILNLTQYSGGPVGVGTMQTWENLLRTFDRALVLGANLDFDLANSYYIYIMSALYFAVPTVTGQLVLGARAGAASMVNSAIGSVSQEAGKMAGSGVGSESVTQIGSNMASVGQAAHAKSLRQSGGGLGLKAIEYGNQGMREEMAGAALGAAQTGSGLMKDQIANTNQSRQFALEAAFSHSGVAGAAMTRAGRVADSGLSRVPGIGGFFGGASATGAALTAADGGGGGNGNGTANTPTSGMSGASGAETQGGGTQGQGAPGTDGTPQAPGTRGATSTTGGTSGGGAAAGSNGNRQVGGGGGPLAAAGDAGASFLKNFSEPLRNAGRNQSAQNAFADLSNISRQMADMNVAGFSHGQNAKGYGAAAQRTGAYANFQAEQDSWEAKNKFANQMAGHAVALGHFVGGQSAGPKPTGSPEAMAMSGMLGRDAQRAANWVMPNQRGGFFSEAGGKTQQLNAGYGAAAVGRAYSASTPLEAGVYAAKAEAALLAGTAEEGVARLGGPGSIHTHGGGRDGNQIAAQTNSGTARAGSQGDAGRGSELYNKTAESIGFGAGVGDGASRGAPANPYGANTSPTRVLGGN